MAGGTRFSAVDVCSIIRQGPSLHFESRTLQATPSWVRPEANAPAAVLGVASVPALRVGAKVEDRVIEGETGALAQAERKSRSAMHTWKGMATSSNRLRTPQGLVGVWPSAPTAEDEHVKRAAHGSLGSGPWMDPKAVAGTSGG